MTKWFAYGDGIYNTRWSTTLVPEWKRLPEADFFGISSRGLIQVVTKEYYKPVRLYAYSSAKTTYYMLQELQHNRIPNEDRLILSVEY